jgi:protein TonB
MRPAVWLSMLFLLAACQSKPQKPTARAAVESPQIRVSETLNCVKLVHYVRPVYPKEARRKRIQGTVRFNAVITKTGEIRDLRLIEGAPALVTAALAAVKQWRYAPCTLNLEPVQVSTEIDVNFNLSQ